MKIDFHLVTTRPILRVLVSNGRICLPVAYNINLHIAPDDMSEIHKLIICQKALLRHVAHSSSEAYLST